MTNTTILKAIELLKESGYKGKARAFVSETNKNVVEIFNETGLDCLVNTRSGVIREV